VILVVWLKLRNKALGDFVMLTPRSIPIQPIAMRMGGLIWRLKRETGALLLALGALASVATAAERTWVADDGIWVDRPPLSNDPNWSNSDEPDLNDEAIFNDNDSVTMSGGNSVQALTMSGGIDLRTSDSALAVTGLVELSGSGTNLIVNGVNSVVQADAITVNSGADIHLEGGTLLTVGSPAAGGIDVNIGGEITGYGLIFLGDQVPSLTTVLTLDGELTAVGPIGIPGSAPSPGTLQIIGNGVNTQLDLDGSGGGGDGIVNVNRNATLDINVPLSDAIFDGTINLGAGATLDILDISGLLGLGGTINVNSGASGGPFPLTAAPARIAGLQLIGYFNGAIILDQADEVLVLDVPYVGAATINNSGTIVFNAPANIQAGFSMTGPGAGLIVNPGVSVSVAAENFDGNTTIGPGGLLNVASGSDDVITGGLNLNGGTFNFDALDNQWNLGGTLNVGAGTGVSQIGGDAITFGANATVGEFATLQFNAPITVNSSTTMVNAGANLVLAGPITFNNGPGIITGPGTVTQANNATVIGNSGVTVSTYDWDGGSTTVNPGVTFTLDVDHIDTGGDLTNDTHNHMINNHGTLSVTVADGEWELGTAGDLNFNYTSPGSLPTLQGSRLRVVPGGRIDVNGRAQIEAPVILEEGSTPGTGTAVTIVGVGTTGFTDEASVVFAGGLTLAGGDVLDTINRDTLDSWMAISNGLTVTGISTIDVETIRWDASPTTIGRTGELSLIADHIQDVGPTQRHGGTITINSGKLMVDLGAHDLWITDSTLRLNNTLNQVPVVSGPDTVQVGDDAIQPLIAHLEVGGTGQSTISAPITFMSDADVNIAAAAVLYTSGTTTFNSDNGLQDAEFTGAGTWLIGGQTTFVETTTLNLTAGTVDLDGGADDNTGNTVNVNAPVTMNLGTMASFGQVNLFLSRNILQIGIAGSLTVNLTDPNGEWTVNAPGVITYNGDATNSLFLRGSDINMNGTLNVNGEGQITARLDIGASGEVNINSPGEDLNFNGGSITDPNTINGGEINGPGVLSLNISHALFGFGDINANVAAAGNAELRADNGTLTVNAAVTDVGVFGTADVDGILNVTNAWNTNVTDSVELRGGRIQGQPITNDGPNGINGFGDVDANVVNNTRIDAEGGLLRLNNSANDWDGTTNAGSLNAVSGNLELRDDTEFPVSGIVSAGGGFEVFANGFALEFEPASQLNMAGGTFRSTHATDIGGTVNAAAGTPSTIAVPATVLFENDSNTSLDGDLRLDNTNTLVAVGAEFSGGGSFVNLNGRQLTLADGADVEVLVENQGALQIAITGPGRADANDFQQTASGQFNVDLAGTELDEFDRLVTNGTAQIDGALNVALFGGFNPALGDMFTIISAAGGVSGVFSTVNPPMLDPGLVLDVIYNPTSVVLQIAELAGDFNQDGSVDAADYVVWRKTDGSQDGYGTWRTHFGKTVGGGSAESGAVPESETALLLLFAVAVMMIRRLKV
jgi:hypothetical protein